MVTYTIDRFEGAVAVLEGEDGALIQVARVLLPPEAAESDVVCFEGGAYTLDSSETEARRATALALRKKLKRK